MLIKFNFEKAKKCGTQYIDTRKLSLLGEFKGTVA
jgi:hypothetical protein